MNIVNKGALLFLLHSCVNLSSTGQFVKISGTVTDLNNKPIPRATIFLKGNKLNRTMTDELGKFVTVRNSETDSIIGCTHINFKTAEQKIEGNSIVNLILYPNDGTNRLPVFTDSSTTFDDSFDHEKRYADSLRVANANKIFTRVEISPEFHGGQYVLMKYYKVGLRLAKLSMRNDINGVITLAFTIKKDGTLENVRLLKGMQKELDDVIIKLTEQLPKWKPAMQNGKYCDYNYSLSIPINLKVIKR